MRPGHVFPLRCNPGGVLRRKGHTEAASDLARLAGLYPAAALCEIVNEDGSMARRPDLSGFAARHGLPIVTVSSLISYRKRTEPFIRHTGQSRIPTRHGEFTAHAFHSSLDNVEHLALVMGEVRSDTAVLVRVHSECLTGDILGSQRCDCGTQLDLALRNICEEGRGVLVYLRGHEGRGIGLAHKLRAYELQDHGRDTVEANVELGLPVDARDYTAGANILKHFGIQRIRLMTNNPVKLQALASHDLQIVERVPLEIPPNRENHHYLMTKKKKLGHLLQPHNVMPSEIG